MMKLRNAVFFLVAAGLILCSPGRALAKGPVGGRKGTVAKTSTNDLYKAILINNVYNYYGNNGDGSFNPYTSDNEGFEFPKGSGGDVIFEDGLVWGCFQNGVKKVGGSTYFHGIQAGKILTAGTNGTGTDFVADNPGLAKYRIYKVRPDINPATPENDADVQAKLKDELQYIVRFEPAATIHSIYQSYIDDWNQWPAADGAPYTDVNANGSYDPGTDVPGVSGADCTLWYVGNDGDGSRTEIIGGVPPIGIEEQTTIWAYNRSGPLSSAIFKKYKFINKSGTRLDSMFVCQWADPDLGGALGAGDDFVGCDTSLSLGYVYNGEPVDGFYGTSVPAGGFVFFQGPKVPGEPGDSAIFGGQVLHGYRNLKMSAFIMFINGNATYIDPRTSSVDATNDWYNLLNGLVTQTGAPFINQVTGDPTKFVMAGDPVRKSGWIEGRLAPPGDRRMGIVAGPWTMAAGDTQEVVVSNLAAQASDYLSSVSLLKFNTTFAQAAYNSFFVLASPPPSPKVVATALNGQVSLDWSNATSAAATENFTSGGYSFEGYNVYQLANNSPSLTGAKLLEVHDKVDGVGYVDDLTFDAATGTTLTKTVEFGTDFGLQRYYTTSTDVFTNAPLINGHTYYFAVTAYSYNAGAFPKTLETPPVVLSLVPQSPNPGTVLNANVGDNIATSSNLTVTGLTDASLIVKVVDPTRITGDLYTVTINAGPPKSWNIYDSSTHVMKASNVTAFADDPTVDPVVDGLRFALLDPGAAGGFKSAQLISDGATDYSASPKPIIHRKDPTGTWIFDVIGATSTTSAYQRMGGSKEGSHDYEIRVVAPAQGSLYYSSNFTVGPGETTAGTDRMPLQFWDITDNKQLIPAIRDADGDGLYTPDLGEGPGPSGGITSLTGKVWDAIYVQDPASTGYYVEPLANPATATSAGYAFRRIMFMNPDTGSSTFPVPAGTVIRLITNKPVLPSNSFALNTAGVAPVVGNQTAAKQTVQGVNVWPNPYFGFNPMEANKYQRFVTISHLPARATIRIFNLAGVLVRTLIHSDPSQFHQWDLNNEAGLPVAAGMYIINIDMPDLGTSKTLKLAVIPEQQYLDRY